MYTVYMLSRDHAIKLMQRFYLHASVIVIKDLKLTSVFMETSPEMQHSLFPPFITTLTNNVMTLI